MSADRGYRGGSPAAEMMRPTADVNIGFSSKDMPGWFASEKIPLRSRSFHWVVGALQRSPQVVGGDVAGPLRLRLARVPRRRILRAFFHRRSGLRRRLALARGGGRPRQGPVERDVPAVTRPVRVLLLALDPVAS